MNDLFSQRFYKILLIIFLVPSLLFFKPGPPLIAHAGTAGFNVSGRSLLDANGNNFIMRGINAPHNWYPAETSSSFLNIKAKGANTVRVVLSSGQNWPKNSASDVANVINLCKTDKLVCILEVHDTTGYGEDASATSLAQAVSYWKEIKSALIGQEAYVIINIGNEPYGNTNASGWINDTKNAIADLRSAGFQHMLMVDAPDWGQDWEFIMRDNASSIFNSDPLKNTVFSIHMYGVFDTAAKVQNYVSTFVNAGLPLVIGEFGYQHTDGDPDEDAIMSVAQANGIGYLGWVWSGGGFLDMVNNFDPNQETWWGNRIIHGQNGIAATSQEASIYSSTNAHVLVSIAGNNQSNYYLAPHNSLRLSYTGINNGPVKILSTNNISLIGAERVIYQVNGSNTSFTEMMALPDTQLSTTYWLPWYNNVDLDTQLRFGNVSGTTAHVHVWIGGAEMTGSPFTLATGQSKRVSFAGINNGPVKIQSDQNVVAAERVIYTVNGTQTSFTEMMALPNSQLTTTYWLPWYNNIDLDTQLRFGNVSGLVAHVHVYIGTDEMTGSPFTLQPGESTRQSFAGINNGPVRIQSDQNVVSAERVIYTVNGTQTSFSEMMALPNSQLNTTYWLPWYNNVDLDTQLRFGNVSSSTAHVHVWIGGVEMASSPFTLATGQSNRVSFTGINNGPVKIQSDQNVVAAERVIYTINGTQTSFSEMMALPDSQLNATYWLPWYNNVDLDTQLRFGVP